MNRSTSLSLQNVISPHLLFFEVIYPTISSSCPIDACILFVPPSHAVDTVIVAARICFVFIISTGSEVQKLYPEV
jgi:hypothetical protein